MVVDPNVIGTSAWVSRWTLISGVVLIGGVYLVSLIPAKARRLLLAVALAVLVGGVAAMRAQGINPPFGWECCPNWFPIFCIPPWLITC